ncbi:hypothetical protein [Staphylococcus gallinarum]|uniref:hypothetical protein n=1 Tax=Staphylococcus gallinarum TaxID=1293 RepID=UPI001E6357B2|nr:hypothetical protein [Staphylococcus gallinarum]MCD8845162.1 hypothetical protein [Staphylococcus gallinarum]
MFEYKKALKEVEKLESMVNVINNSNNNSGYRVQVSYCNGLIYKQNHEEYIVDIYVIDNYKNYNNKGQEIQMIGISNIEEEYRLPCKIFGDPINSKGIIKEVIFNKEVILEELKKNEKYIVNPHLGTVEIPDGENTIVVKHIIPKNIKVYFEDKNEREIIDNMLMAKTDIIEEFNIKPSYFDVSVNRGKLNPYLKKGKTNIYLRSEVIKFINENKYS